MSTAARWSRLALRYALLEVKLYAALIRWCLRRRDVPPGAEPWGYAQLVTPVMWLWVFGSATELVVLHLVLPWERVRLAADVVSAWGLIWMLGTLAAYRIRPHLLLGDVLRVRSGVHHDLAVPLRSIEAASVREVDLPSSMLMLQVEPDSVSVGVSGRTNVTVTLKEPADIATAKGALRVRHVRLWADDPRGLAGRLNELARTHGAPPALKPSR